MATDKSVKRKLTTRDLEVVFGVTTMTVHNWRKGSATKEPLPVIKEDLEKGQVRFAPKITASWAKKNGVTMVSPIDQAEPGLFTKPGPKPRLAA